MRFEHARVGRQARGSRGFFVSAGQEFEFVRRLDADPHIMGIVAAECPEAGETNLKSVGVYCSEIGGKFLGQ